MVRLGFGIALLACLVAFLSDAGACGRRRGRSNCCSTAVYCAPVCAAAPCDGGPAGAAGGPEQIGPGTVEPGTGDTDTGTAATPPPTAKEQEMWKFLTENGYEQKDYDL